MRQSPGWGPIVVSVGVVVAGLWLALGGQARPPVASFGWLLAVVGMVFLLVNLALRRRGYPPPRRRR